TSASRREYSRRWALTRRGLAEPPSRGLAPLPQLVQRPRPVSLEDAGKGAIRQQLTVRLAARAVIGLVLGIDDPLHRRAARRTGQVVAAVDGHAWPEGRHLLRQIVARLTLESLAPFGQDLPRRPEKTLHLLVA